MAGRLYVISGPSGAGKSTVIRRLMKEEENLGYSVSHTTRRPRTGEVDGVDYHFVEKETFQRMIREGDFLEWAEVYSGDLYGTSRSGLHRQLEKGVDVILDVDVEGAGNVRRGFEGCTLIFLIPPSLDVLEKRLRARGTDTADAVRTRTEKALREIRECPSYDYIVFNDRVEDAVRDIRSIIRAERLRTSVQVKRVSHSFPIE
jgi:guanylate kinase